MKLTLALASAAALAPIVASQAPSVVIPRLAENLEANDITFYPFGRTGFRCQQVLDESTIATVGGVILGIEYRPDVSNSTGSPAVTLNNLSIDLSQTAVTPTSMSTTFATNVTGTPTNVFQGTVNLPAHSSVPGTPAPWFNIPLTTPFAFSRGIGDLLIDITATDPNSTSTGYALDSALPGGAVNLYGTSGQLSQPDGVRTIISGNGTSGRFSGIIPGGQFSILVSSQFQVWSGALMLGFARSGQPFDLGVVGAPNNFVYIDPVDSYPYTLAAPPIGFGYRYSWTLAVPSNPNLVGASLHMQPFVFDGPANPLGVVTMSAVECVIGDAFLAQVRQLNSSNYQSATGNYQYTSGIYGGAVVRLNGAFQ